MPEKLPVPSWAKEDVHPEDACSEWRERHRLAALELAEMCGLVEITTIMGANGKPRPYAMEAENRDQERVEAVFGALKTLIEIDPEMKR